MAVSTDNAVGAIADNLGERANKEDDEGEKVFAEERERQAKREAEIERSWSKAVLVEGKGRQAWQGARATVHVVGRLRFDDGDVFEDSRAREEPQLLLLGRGSVSRLRVDAPGPPRCRLACDGRSCRDWTGRC